MFSFKKEAAGIQKEPNKEESFKSQQKDRKGLLKKGELALQNPKKWEDYQSSVELCALLFWLCAPLALAFLAFALCLGRVAFVLRRAKAFYARAAEFYEERATGASCFCTFSHFSLFFFSFWRVFLSSPLDPEKKRHMLHLRFCFGVVWAFFLGGFELCSLGLRWWWPFRGSFRSFS